MSTKAINITISSLPMKATLNDSISAQKIWNALPLRAQVNTWGEEIYFEIPVSQALESEFAREEVSLGDLGYWPEGRCFCIFFGKTPVSTDESIRPASAVNVIGKITGDLALLKKVRAGETVVLERI